MTRKQVIPRPSIGTMRPEDYEDTPYRDPNDGLNNSNALNSWTPSPADRWERALVDLSDMQDAHTQVQLPILRVVERLLPIVRLHARVPSFEVDEDDGTVTLRWKEPGVPRSFALAIVRPETFVAVLAEPGLGDGFSVSLRADDEAALVKVLESNRVARLVK